MKTFHSKGELLLQPGVLFYTARWYLHKISIFQGPIWTWTRDEEAQTSKNRFGSYLQLQVGIPLNNVQNVAALSILMIFQAQKP